MRAKVSRLGIILGLLVLLGYGFVAGAVGSELFDTERILEEPQVHLPAQAIFPESERERSARGGILGLSGFAITNSMLSSWVTTLLLVIIFVAGASRKKLIPGRFQGIIEVVVEGLLTFVEGVSGREMARRFLPIIATIFLFVLVNAWIGLLPIYSSLGFVSSPESNRAFVRESDEGTEMELHGTVSEVRKDEKGILNQLVLEDRSYDEAGPIDDALYGYPVFVVTHPNEVNEIPRVGDKIHIGAIKSHGMIEAESVSSKGTPRVNLLRPAGTDVNMPLALALVAFVFIEFWGLKRLGLSYMSKFVRLGNLVKGPKYFFTGMIDVFVGILEALSEVIRIVSFTFRLFGNMLAGKLLIIVSTFLVPFVFSIPFYGLEILVGFIQAMIFAGLALTFATVAVSQHEE